GQRHRNWDVGPAYQFLVDVKLGTAWRAFAVGDVGLACRKELEGESDFPLWYLFRGLNVELLGPDVVMRVVKLLVLYKERVAAGVTAMAQQHALGAALWNLDLGRD